MDFGNKNQLLNSKCVFVFCSLFVWSVHGLYRQSVLNDHVKFGKVSSDDNDIYVRSSDAQSDEIDVNYGEHLENSIKTVQNDYRTNLLKMVCRFHLCSDWSAWSRCGSVVGRRGTRSRTRKCGSDLQVCKQDSLGRSVQSQPCILHIPWCPLEYNYTRNRFCVKLYGNDFKSWYDAQLQCESDGGNLINIDTKTLSDDIDEVFGKSALLSISAWIDGIKRTSSLSWEFKSGLRSPTFSNWHTGQPRVESFPLCKCVIQSGDNGKFKWRISSVCGNRENFICQIKK